MTLPHNGARAIAKRKYKKKVELQRAFNASPTTVQNWTNEPTFPGGKDGPWEHAAVAAWVQSNKKPTVTELRGRALEMKLREQAARTLSLEVDAETKALKLAKLKKNLIEVEKAREEIESDYVFIRDSVIRLPEELAANLPTELKAAHIADGLRRVEALLIRLANRSKRITRTDDV